MLAEQLDRLHDLLVRDVVGVDQAQQQVTAGCLVAAAGLDALVGVTDDAVSDAADGLSGRCRRKARGLAEDVRYYGKWMRDEAEKRMDAAFDIKAFHDHVLGLGAVTLPILADLVEDWVSSAAG